MNPILRGLLVVSGCLLATVVHAAGLDPEVDKPYKLDVVLILGKHRLLTDVFRDQISRELSDGLQAGGGDIVEVNVLHKHDRVKDIENKGLLEALKEYKVLSERKTHFVRLDYVDGEYEIQVLQYDGMTGMTSPVLRKRRTSDRQFVARLVTLLIAQDFGPVATVIDSSNLDQVKIQFKAAQRGKLDRWVNHGELLLVTGVVTGGKTTRPVPDAVLQLQTKDPKEEGVWLAKLYHRYDNPLAAPNVLGYRCLRIATVKTSLKLRVVQRDARQLTPVGDLGIQVRKNDFKDDKEKVERLTDREGYLRLPNVYERMVFITALTQPRSALIPVPLVDDEPVTLSVIVRQDSRSLLALRKQIWEQQVNEGNATQTNIFKELKELNSKPDQRDKAMDYARKGAQDSEKLLKELGEARQSLVDQAGKSGEKIDLNYGDQFLTRIEQGKKELEEYLVAQEKILKEELPKQKRRLERIEEGKFAEREADFERALKIYAEVLDGQPDENLRKHHEQLKAAWATKGAPHEAARKYVYESWPMVEIDKTDKVKEALVEARKALKACREGRDLLTPQKFLLVAVVHAGKLKDQLDALRPDLQEDDVKKAEELADVTKEFNKVVAEAQKDLQAK